MTNESQPAAKGGEQVLTVGVAQFRAALALYPAEDQEILEWLRGYLYQALGGQVQPRQPPFGSGWRRILRWLKQT